jgi:hypothetical protein
VLVCNSFSCLFYIYTGESERIYVAAIIFKSVIISAFKFDMLSDT